MAILRAAERGFNDASEAERAGFALLSSFATTIVATRGVNYVRERRRPAPALRSVARRIVSAPRTGSLRVHHFLPGIGTAFVTGGLAILTRKDRWHVPLSLPFGVGVALTSDELAILVQADNPYWGSERLAIAQATAATVGAAALGATFVRRGAR